MANPVRGNKYGWYKINGKWIKPTEGDKIMNKSAAANEKGTAEEKKRARAQREQARKHSKDYSYSTPRKKAPKKSGTK